jgi:hypothetical protein
MGRVEQAEHVRSLTSGVGTPTIPPLARRPVIARAMALREEINDSWRLLVGSLGAALLVALFLFMLAAALG